MIENVSGGKIKGEAQLTGLSFMNLVLRQTIILLPHSLQIQTRFVLSHTEKVRSHLLDCLLRQEDE